MQVFRMSAALALAAPLIAPAPLPAAAQPPAAQTSAEEAAQMREDALGVEALINLVYAYPERLPGGRFTLTSALRQEAERVSDRRSLLRFAERALFLLADHHAITGSSFNDSWAVVPSYSDLWIEPRGGDFVIEAVRRGSPAEVAGIRAGDVLTGVDGVAVSDAVRAFWVDLGADATADRMGFAARMLAAGRRDRPRRLTIRRGNGPARAYELANLYTAHTGDRPAVEAGSDGSALHIRIHDSLGDSATIAAFDTAMRTARPRQRVIVDLTDTPSGGNTSVARGILGWFVDRPRFYQMHSLPTEQRETGIARQWVEQVLPRPGMRHNGPVEVRVGRWTGSMGEGLAIGFDSIGARVTGTRMAGLLGAIYDHPLPHSGLVLKIPTERLMTVDGLPRENFVPRPMR
jgi:C-terminal processing protease CtpA/Prc